MKYVWVNWNHFVFWPVHLQQEHKGGRGDQQAARPVARAQKVQAGAQLVHAWPCAFVAPASPPWSKIKEVEVPDDGAPEPLFHALPRVAVQHLPLLHQLP